MGLYCPFLICHSDISRGAGFKVHALRAGITAAKRARMGVVTMTNRVALALKVLGKDGP